MYMFFPCYDWLIRTVFGAMLGLIIFGVALYVFILSKKEREVK